LKKSIAYTLSSNIPEIAPFLLFQTAAIPLPLSTVMILLVDLGTDLAPAISMAYEGRESDIMQRKPRDPAIHKLVTWSLVSFAYLQIGMLQAIAGFYAYFVVLNGFGFTPGHLMGLDHYRIFNEQRNAVSLRDAYYLWCFDPAIRSKCEYLPNFYYGSYAPISGFDEEIPYYTNEEFAEWQGNDHGYAIEAKELLVEYAKDMNYATPLTMDMLKDNTALDWATFEATYWKSSDETAADSLFGKLSEDSYKSENSRGTILFPSRRCYADDYSSFYRTATNADGETVKLADATPPFCDTEDYPKKPRTHNYKVSERSLFPMETRARVESLAMSNSAYFISIIVVQWADLMICKTRVRSLFEQGMTNTFMNYALFFETILGAFLVYVPVANTVTGTRPLRFTWWTAAIPFSLLIYIYDELRKGWIRKNRAGWLHRNTYW
jgi:sodium/potassium-transporting ATPase subunit alpha